MDYYDELYDLHEMRRKCPVGSEDYEYWSALIAKKTKPSATQGNYADDRYWDDMAYLAGRD